MLNHFLTTSVLWQGSVRVLADGRLWISLRDVGGHHVTWLWSRDADRYLVLNKCAPRLTTLFDHTV